MRMQRNSRKPSPLTGSSLTNISQENEDKVKVLQGENEFLEKERLKALDELQYIQQTFSRKEKDCTTLQLESLLISSPRGTLGRPKIKTETS